MIREKKERKSHGETSVFTAKYIAEKEKKGKYIAERVKEGTEISKKSNKWCVF